MKIKEIDFNNIFFKKRFVDFCISSLPIEEVEYGSLESKTIQAKSYLAELHSSDIAIFSINDRNKPVIYCFFDKKEQSKTIDLSFVFPAQAFSSVKKLKELRWGFYICCLKAMELSGYDKINAKVRRRHKKASMIKFLKRWCKAFEIKKIKKGYSEKLIIKKKHLEYEIKKLQL